MAFDIQKEDEIIIEEQPKKGACHFRGKIHFSEGYHDLFQSKFHQDRSTLHIIAAILEKYPQGAYFQQRLTLNGVKLFIFEKDKKVYIFLQSEMQS
ncbi:MAG: hypothetical protein HFI75_07835 [Lachnospiraceae bacterium]|nr:hypothetical protein [Lachnospiraceae bacterium]